MKDLLSSRARSIDASGIRKVFDLAAHLEDPADFSIGQPHFDIDPEVKQAACNAILDGFNRYTPSQGIIELRDRILEIRISTNQIRNFSPVFHNGKDLPISLVAPA